MNPSRLPQRSRSTIFSARWQSPWLGVLVIASGVLFSSPSGAGPCPVSTRTYCVAGASTGSDWSWRVDLTTSDVDASASPALNPGDPAADIVSRFVSDLTSNSFTASTNTANTCTCPGGCLDGFDLDSCGQLAIETPFGSGTYVPVPLAPATATFNPEISRLAPSTPVPSISGPGITALLGLMSLAGGYAMHQRRRRVKSQGSARGSEGSGE